MAISVNFGTDNKKRNSTKIPSVGVEVSCVLKEGTNVENPTFILQNVSPWLWNVAHCPTFGRYYFVDDIKYLETRYEVSCSCDYLASYKSEILSNTVYVTRSASLHNEDITDTLFPTNSQATIQKTLSGSFGFSNSGSIILTTAGKTGNSFHALNSSQFSALCNYLYSSTFIDLLTDWTKVGDIITKQFFNTSDYILSACWVPVDIGGGGSSISLGSIDNCGSGTELSQGRIWHNVVTVTAPNHPQLDGYHYRNVEPFSRYSLSIPYIGTIPIDGSYLNSNRTISIGMGMDINGNIDCTVFSPVGSYGTFFGSSGANIGVGSRSSNGGGNIIKGAGELLASGVTGNVLGATSGILSLTSGLVSSSISSSGSGGCVAQDDYCTLTSTFLTQLTVDNTNLGRPLCQPTSLSVLSGYVICENASVQCNATSTGKSIINNFLNGGMFIE